MTFGTALIHTEGMKGAQCTVTAFPVLPRAILAALT